MKRFKFFLFLTTIQLFSEPWTLDSLSRQKIETQIEQRHQERLAQMSLSGCGYCLDEDLTRLNFPAHNCLDCQSNASNLEKRLNQSFFEKIPNWHCYGVTFSLIQFLLENPDQLTNSCNHILLQVKSDPNFEHKSHEIWAHQHSFYRTLSGDNPLQLNVEKMKTYFQIVFGRKPQEYYAIPLSTSNPARFYKAEIYATLEQLKDRILIVAHSEDGARINHVIAISNYKKNYLLFDSNLGLFRFNDLETLSHSCEELLQKNHFLWLAAFQPDGA